MAGTDRLDFGHAVQGLIVPSLKCVRWKARVIVVGFAAGTIEKIPANLILLKNISIVGVHWGAYTSEFETKVDRLFWRGGELILIRAFLVICVSRSGRKRTGPTSSSLERTDEIVRGEKVGPGRL